jgi:hypothetical protein
VGARHLLNFVILPSIYFPQKRNCVVDGITHYTSTRGGMGGSRKRRIDKGLRAWAPESWSRPTPPPKRHKRSFFSSFFSDKQKWRLLGSLNVSTPLLTPSSLSSCLSISLYLRWWWYSFLAATPPLSHFLLLVSRLPTSEIAPPLYSLHDRE